ncbi:hypothetical protein ACFX1Z_000209 [Malus domestica]
MKKVHVALDIPSEYREWHWLLSPIRLEKGGLPPREEIKRIKEETLACPIAIVEPAVNEGEKKRSSPPAQEMPAEKKRNTSSATREGLFATDKLVIDLTSSKRKKDEVTRSEPVRSVVPHVANMITDKIAQRRGFVVPTVLKFVPKRPSGAKSSSLLERLATMKSDKVDSAAKMAPKPTPLAAETDSPVEKEKTTRIGKCEKSTAYFRGGC